MVDDGSGAEIMYPDLYKGLKLRPEDLMPYNSPLMSFDGKIVMPKGQIKLPMQTGPKIVEVNFIVVDTYSPYTAIVTRPWLHTLGAVASTLHQKVKFPSEGQALEIRGCQARQESAWWLPFHIGSKQSPWPMLEKAHSNQRPSIAYQYTNRGSKM